MTMDRRPTRAEAEAALLASYTGENGIEPLSGADARHAAELLDRAGFIRPEPRPVGWYRIKPMTGADWICDFWRHDGRWSRCHPLTEAIRVGARIDMPDDTTEGQQP